MKKEWYHIALVMGAVVLASVLLFDESSEGQIAALQARIVDQKRANQVLREQLLSMKIDIDGISHNDRYLEQFSRNRLGLARDKELVFLFQEEAN